MTWWLHPIEARVKTSIKTPLGMHSIDLKMSFLRDIFVIIIDFELHRSLIVFPAVQRRRVNRRRTWWLSLSQPQALRWVGGGFSSSICLLVRLFGGGKSLDLIKEIRWSNQSKCKKLSIEVSPSLYGSEVWIGNGTVKIINNQGHWL